MNLLADFNFCGFVISGKKKYAEATLAAFVVCNRVMLSTVITTISVTVLNFP